MDVDVAAIALLGAVRSAGEAVMTAADRPRAVDDAARVIDLLLDGLAA